MTDFNPQELMNGNWHTNKYIQRFAAIVSTSDDSQQKAWSQRSTITKPSWAHPQITDKTLPPMPFDGNNIAPEFNTWMSWTCERKSLAPLTDESDGIKDNIILIHERNI